MTTHRTIQLSQLVDCLTAKAGEARRAASNAASIGNRTMAIEFTTRAWRMDGIRRDAQRRLQVQS